MESLNPDLEGSNCSVANCFKVADVMALETVTISPIYGYHGDDATTVLEIPLCIDHAHKLRGGVETCTFESYPGH